MTGLRSPRVGWPRLGSPAAAAVAAAVHLGGQRALPNLVEPDELTVHESVDEPLVDVTGLDPRIAVVPHYALGGWANAIDRCWLREQAASHLLDAVGALPDRFGFVVYDGWRPRSLQEELYSAAFADPAVPPGFLAEPSRDAERPAPHESGGAVDLALTFDGSPIAPGTDFDDVTPRAFAAALEAEPGPDREARRLLYWAMHHAGFIVYAGEWWHFEFGTRRWAAIVGHQPRYAATCPPTLR